MPGFQIPARGQYLYINAPTKAADISSREAIFITGYEKFTYRSKKHTFIILLNIVYSNNGDLREQINSNVIGGSTMDNYSYSKEINQNKVVFCEADIEKVRGIFTKIFESYDMKIKDEMFDSFCEDFYCLIREIPASNERIWRMIITDMFFSYDDRGYLEVAATNNTFKRKQFAILANIITGELRI